jgi:hypothetical protein
MVRPMDKSASSNIPSPKLKNLVDSLWWIRISAYRNGRFMPDQRIVHGTKG